MFAEILPVREREPTRARAVFADGTEHIYPRHSSWFIHLKRRNCIQHIKRLFLPIDMIRHRPPVNHSPSEYKQLSIKRTHRSFPHAFVASNFHIVPAGAPPPQSRHFHPHSYFAVACP